mmetsp:Transcript_9573/g.18050  ORF Transcript_9573/g.18050 Transcript_9573/m.18050 type:complete len:614 (+) Transcript_9573:319-2160(+)|eukprot:CAMPEP_0203744794 /NCGR_PEP_ID=MMETSP0098-20131031/749_1 /ASSEMBLY_ACC=CAM_ASM_000208 /TAXON_ID=96639 /ORGANISM=" , Strain NY0313808BC1" /LENGTH=613 /DNA_ID=CAMNT_0050632417 /DNA_START=226 /DNA_END=2067 /DNA_ORIENTATION=-
MPPVATESKSYEDGLKHRESEKWEKFDVNKWRSAMFTTRGYFKQLYADTPRFVREVVEAHQEKACPAGGKKLPVRLIEVGSGTGEFLFSMVNEKAKDIDEPLIDSVIGIEFNAKFVGFCNERKSADFADDDIHFVLGDAQDLVEVVQSSSFAHQPGKELLVLACVNNTFGIMPNEVRERVYKEIVKLMQLDPENIILVAGYWDGNHFGNSIQHFYGDNPTLCGDLKNAQIDWGNNTMTTTSGYTTRWTSPEQAYDKMLELGLKCSRIEARSRGVLVEATLPVGSQRADRPRDESKLTASEETSQNYYDSEDAFKFYTIVWGGDNIHIGLYDETTDVGHNDLAKQVRLASERILDVLCSKVSHSLVKGANVMDMGSALGGCSRYIAQNYGCNVLGIDLSKKECRVNAQKTTRAGLDHLVKVRCASFTTTLEPSTSYDVILSEDSFLHAGPYRADTVKEAARLLKPGGYFCFTDIMEADEVDKKALAPIYNRIHLSSMGSVAFYKAEAKKHGLEFVEFHNLTEHLVKHYSTVQKVLLQKKAELIKQNVNPRYIENMDKGLNYWVDGGNAGLLNYGILIFKKPSGPTIEDLAETASHAADLALQCAQMARKLSNSE